MCVLNYLIRMRVMYTTRNKIIRKIFIVYNEGTGNNAPIWLMNQKQQNDVFLLLLLILLRVDHFIDVLTVALGSHAFLFLSSSMR